MKQLLARRPQLALPFSILPQPDEVILVAGEDFRYRFTAPGLGGWLPSFLARLDGSLSVQELLGGLEEAQRDAALQVLERLIGERAAIEGSARSAHVPQVARVAVEGSGELRELLANGLNCDEPTLVVLAQDRLDYAAALACNRRCRQQGLPWLWASTGAMQRGYVSPLFLPDAGPCFACLLRSFQQLSPVPDLYDALIAHSRNQGALVPGPFAPTALRILEQLLRWKVEQASAAEAPAALYRLHVLECATMELAAHRVFVDFGMSGVSRRPAVTAWATNLYTGLFTTFGTQRPRAHDPDLALCSGTMARWGRAGSGAQGSGIGWTAAEAEAACLGEAIERLQAAPLPEDRHVESRFQDWALDEPAVPPADWVLFHPAQYAQAGFPFRLFTPATICSWVCFREVPTGQPWWVPAEMAWLDLGPGCSHRLTAGVSTGLACGRPGQPLVLRGLHEAIERDAVVGAWWERYPLEEHGIDEVLARLGRSDARARLLRPNLRYKCFRIDSPFSDGVTLVALEGEDREGFIFSAGSACRETLALSWEKALLEAVHGRHYARYLKGEIVAGRRPALAVPISFADHAVYYSLHPERLRETVLARPSKRGSASVAGRHEGREELCERLGSRRPVLVRNMTPPALAREGLDWHVVRVLVPGLQPLHGSHPLAHLGGSLWAPRGLSDWVGQPPHPFP